VEVSVEVRLYCTGTMHGGEPTVCGLEIQRGRPDVGAIMQQHCADGCGRAAPYGARGGGDGSTMAFVSGPSSLTGQARAAAQACGVAVHEEVFEL
jgi:hypothetical protein